MFGFNPTPKTGDGNSVGKKISKKKVREEVIERDGNWCFICGKPPKGLHLHRIMYGSQGGKYVTENCVQLCTIHHGEIHSNKRYWQPLLMGYVKEAEQGIISFEHY